MPRVPSNWKRQEYRSSYGACRGTAALSTLQFQTLGWVKVCLGIQVKGIKNYISIIWTNSLLLHYIVKKILKILVYNSDLVSSNKIIIIALSLTILCCICMYFFIMETFLNFTYVISGFYFPDYGKCLYYWSHS